MRRFQWWALAAAALSGVVHAQPASVLPYSEWTLSYAYAIDARIDIPGQVVTYQAGSSGEVVLRWDQDPDTQKTFVGALTAPIAIRYEGEAFNTSDGCGMRELLHLWRGQGRQRHESLARLALRARFRRSGQLPIAALRERLAARAASVIKLLSPRAGRG